MPLFFPLAGAPTYSRALTARQLAWLVRQLGRRFLVPAVRCILPAVLATLDDPSPFVETQGSHWYSEPQSVRCALLSTMQCLSEVSQSVTVLRCFPLRRAVGAVSRGSDGAAGGSTMAAGAAAGHSQASHQRG